MPCPMALQDLFPIMVDKEFRAIWLQVYRLGKVSYNSISTLSYYLDLFIPNFTFLLSLTDYLPLVTNSFSHPLS